jgi:hypothetical protein
MTVAVFAHPAGAGEMTLQCRAGALRLALRIDVQDVTRDLAPIRAVGVAVEQALVGDQMDLIVVREKRNIRCSIGAFRIQAEDSACDTAPGAETRPAACSHASVTISLTSHEALVMRPRCKLPPGRPNIAATNCHRGAGAQK